MKTKTRGGPRSDTKLTDQLYQALSLLVNTVRQRENGARCLNRLVDVLRHRPSEAGHAWHRVADVLSVALPRREIGSELKEAT